MLRDSRYLKVAMFLFALGAVLPVAAAIFADSASASGYTVAWSDDGTATCVPGGADDCPNAS